MKIKMTGLSCFLVLFGFQTVSLADFYVITAGKKGVRTVLVSPLATPRESGAALLSALAQISDASSTNPYLLVLEPGVYDVGDSSVQMKAYVDIQGAGQDTTTIQGSVAGPSTGLVKGEMAELRHVTVKNSGSGGHTTAIYNHGPTGRLTHVTALAVGGLINYGVRNVSSSPVMTHVTATATGMAGSTNSGVSNQGSSPTMLHVTASASGFPGSTNHGVNNNTSSPNMTLVEATARGGSDSFGVLNSHQSRPVLSQVKASATSATNNYGVYNYQSSSPVMNHVQVSASGGSASHGIYANTILPPSSVTRVNHSVISGETTSVTMGGMSACFLGNTQLIGGVAGGPGAVRCVGAYSQDYVMLSDACQ